MSGEKCPLCGDSDVQDTAPVRDNTIIEFSGIYYGPYKVCIHEGKLYAHGEPE